MEINDLYYELMLTSRDAPFSYSMIIVLIFTYMGLTYVLYHSLFSNRFEESWVEIAYRIFVV